MLYCAMLSLTHLCSILLNCFILHYTILYYAMLCYAIIDSPLFHPSWLYHPTLHYTTLCYAMLCYYWLTFVPSFLTVPSYTTLHYTTLCYAMLYWLTFVPSYTIVSGVCHAENDEDKKAIICLKRSVEEDPYSTDSLLALGTRYLPSHSDV